MKFIFNKCTFTHTEWTEDQMLYALKSAFEEKVAIRGAGAEFSIPHAKSQIQKQGKV